MDPLAVTLSITALLKLTKDVVFYIKETKDAPDERKKFVREISSLSGMLNTLVEFINDCNPSDEWFHAIQELVAANGPLDQFSRALQLLKNKVGPAPGLRKVGQMLAWRQVKDEVNNLLSQTERLKTLTGLALDMDHIRLSNETRRHLQGLQIDIAEILDNTFYIRAETSARQKMELLNWLCEADYFKQQQDSLARRTLGTGEWLLRHPDVRAWSGSSSSTLLCPGDPGVGKTILAASIIEELLKNIQTPMQPVTFIYFNYKRQEEQNVTHVLLTFLRQILQAASQVPGYVSDLYRAHDDRRTTLSSDEIQQVLERMISDLQGLYIVMDAVDECNETTRLGVLSLVRRLAKLTHVRFLATSRKFPSILSDLSFSGVPHLEIKASDQDLSTYIESRFEGFKAKPTAELREILSASVIAAAGGMFLLVQLLMDSFQSKLKIRSIKSDLDRLPKGLDAYDVAYSDAMERIFGQSGESRDYASKILSLILCARRPLTTGEIRHALMVEPGDKDIDEDDAIEMDVIVSVCAGLVTIDTQSNTVGFVHFTTQEYLQRNRGNWLPHANTDIARTCIAYLMLDEFQAGPCRSGDLDDRLYHYNFFEYAAQFAFIHLDDLCEDENALEVVQIAEEALHCLGNPAVMRSAAQSAGSPRAAHAGSITTELVSLELVNRLLFSVSAININHRLSTGRTALSYAAELGNTHVLQALLGTEGVIVDSTSDSGRTPLSYAVVGSDDSKNFTTGYDFIDGVVLPIQFGALPTMSILPGTNHSTTIESLLQTGKANPDLPDQGGRTALSYAAEHGCESNMRQLLETGKVSPDKEDAKGRTPLSYAAESGCELSVRQLLQTGKVSPYRKDQKGRTPLSYAAESGVETVVRELLTAEVGSCTFEHTTGIDLSDSQGRTALSYAAEAGHFYIAELLLCTGNVDVESRDKDERTPLAHAVEQVHGTTTKTLLQYGASTSDTDQNGRTLLSLMAEEGDYLIASILASASGVDVNTVDARGRTPLSYAAETTAGNGFAIVELLCNHSNIVDVDTTDSNGKTPLAYAVSKGNVEATRFLLESRLADPDKVDFKDLKPSPGIRGVLLDVVSTYPDKEGLNSFLKPPTAVRVGDGVRSYSC